LCETSRPGEMSVIGSRLLVYPHIFLLLSLTVSWGNLHIRLMLKVTHSVIKAEWQVQGLLRADTVNSFPSFFGLCFVKVLLTAEIAVRASSSSFQQASGGVRSDV